MYYFTEQREAEKLFAEIAKISKEKKHNVIFLIVPTKQEASELIQELIEIKEEMN